MKVTPKGSGSCAVPAMAAGSASAHQPSRLTKLVYRPNCALAPNGSAATSSKRGWVGAVGTISTSMSDHSFAALRRASSSA